MTNPSQNLPHRLALARMVAHTRAAITPEEYVQNLGRQPGLDFPLTKKQISAKPHMAALLRAAVAAGVPVSWKETSG